MAVSHRHAAGNDDGAVAGAADEVALRVCGLVRPGLAAASFSLGRGRCLAIGGASGSGKTLLLRALADLDPSDGAIFLNGVSRSEIPAPRWRRQVTYVAADAGWWAASVGAHFPDAAVAVALLTDLRLPESALDWPVSRLSTGERQRLALARAIARAPQVLLVDEPTSGLDPAATEAAEALLRRELERGVAIVIVTHDEAQAERLANVRMTMADGVLRAARSTAGDGDEPSARANPVRGNAAP